VLETYWIQDVLRVLLE